MKNKLLCDEQGFARMQEIKFRSGNFSECRERYEEDMA